MKTTEELTELQAIACRRFYAKQSQQMRRVERRIAPQPSFREMLDDYRRAQDEHWEMWRQVEKQLLGE